MTDQPMLVTPRSLVSGNVVSVPTERDEHGNPTAYAPKAVVFVEDDWEDDDANKPFSVMYFDDGTEHHDMFPEIPKWNVLEPGVPFEAVYDDAKKGGQLRAFRSTSGRGGDIPVPDRKKPGGRSGGPGRGGSGGGVRGPNS